MNIDSNINKLVNKWMKRRDELIPGLRLATRRSVAIVLAETKKHINKDIYSKPVPSRVKSGKPAWRRTGNLRRNERGKVLSDFLGLIENPASSKSGGYALARHEMGKPGRPKTRYPAHWRDKSIPVVRPKVAKEFRDAILKAYGGKSAMEE